MAFEINKHVDRLNGYLPFDADYDRLFEEYADQEHKDLPTRALDHLWERTKDRELRLVVLTGDAGHGKTHICAKLLERAGIDAAEVPRLLQTECDGRHDLCVLASGTRLRIIKDLSELEPLQEAADLLVRGLETADQLLIVCANEGRLRSALGEVDPALAPVRAALDRGVQSGELSVDQRLLLVNLNFQSIASPDNSLADLLLRSWAVDRRRWSICGSCDAHAGCPLFENHRQLADDDHGPTRRRALEELLRTAERTGAVITVRELLILVSHAITGGLRCRDVHRRAARDGWQYQYLFSENLFGDRLSPSQRRAARSFREIRLLDPGSVALRGVDDALYPDVADDIGRFVPPDSSEIDPAPVTHKQAKLQATRRRGLMQVLRRRDFFARLQSSVDGMSRLGFRHAADFERIVAGDLGATDFRRIRDSILAGLEAVQGIRRTGGRGYFVLVDPAFSGGAATSIVSHQIASSRVEVRSQSRHWDSKLGRDAEVPRALDWIDRAIVLEFGEDGATPIALDLLSFEFVMRSAQGLNARSFFDADVRRISAELASLGRSSSETDRISVLREGHIEHLVIDKGDVIRAVGD